MLQCEGLRDSLEYMSLNTLLGISIISFPHLRKLFQIHYLLDSMGYISRPSLQRPTSWWDCCPWGCPNTSQMSSTHAVSFNVSTGIVRHYLGLVSFTTLKNAGSSTNTIPSLVWLELESCVNGSLSIICTSGRKWLWHFCCESRRLTIGSKPAWLPASILRNNSKILKEWMNEHSHMTCQILWS